MTNKNSTAIGRGAMLAKVKIASSSKEAGTVGTVRVDTPNRAQRRAAKKQKVRSGGAK